jgi:cytidyltransferase-like protein
MKYFFIALLFVCLSCSSVETIPSKKTIVYVDMVADLFHYGHVAFLSRAKKAGDYLIVGVHSDEDVIKYKRKPILTMLERSKVVSACKYVDEVITNAPLKVTEDFLKKYNIDIVIHGDDINEQTKQDFYGDVEKLGKLKLISYTTGISTTDILRRVESYFIENPNNLPLGKYTELYHLFINLLQTRLASEITQDKPVDEI